MNISLLPKLFGNIRASHVTDFKVSDNGYFLKAAVIFKDESVFHVRELVSHVGREYSYHWQSKDGELIKRWDNAPYHKESASFPHHVHENSAVRASYDISLQDVLARIHQVQQP